MATATIDYERLFAASSDAANRDARRGYVHFLKHIVVDRQPDKRPFSNCGETWQWDISPFPTVTNTQKPVLLRLKEGAILLCSFTDQWRNWAKRKGLTFKSGSGDYTGYGLFAAVSYDDGKTWPDRRLLTPGGPERKWIMKERTPCLLSDTLAEPTGYLAVTQSRDGNIQLVTSRNHYVFNLAWIKQLPSAH